MAAQLNGLNVQIISAATQNRKRSSSICSKRSNGSGGVGDA
jgi:hypothetical protein